MERIGVCVKNGVVVNAIIWADHTAEQLANEGWEHLEEVTDMIPQPSIGWTWNETEGFRPNAPFPSWIWNVDRWEAPIAEPSEGGPYTWNEQTLNWDTIPTEE